MAGAGARAWIMPSGLGPGARPPSIGPGRAAGHRRFLPSLARPNDRFSDYSVGLCVLKSSRSSQILIPMSL